MKKSLLFIILLCSSMFVFASVPTGIKIIKNGSGYTIKFNLPEYMIHNTTSNERSFSTVSVVDYGVTSEPGFPALPQISFNLLISNNEIAPQFSVQNFKVSDLRVENHIYPFQAPYRRDLPLNKRPFNYNEAFYNSEGNLGSPIIKISEPFIISGLKGVTVTIYPFNYLPKEKILKVVNEASFEIKLNNLPPNSSSHSETYSDFLNKFFINYSNLSPRIIKNYLIISAPEYTTNLTAFVNHKTAMGFNVSVFSTSETGTTTTSIKTFIQNRYNNPATKPEFVLLVGDVDKIPAWTGVGEGSPKTDLNYALLEGSDYYADLFIGRFSISNAIELSNIIGKSIYMENNVATLPKNNVFMSSVDNWSITEGTHNNVINSYFQPAGYENQKLYSHTYNATTAQLIAALNANKIFSIYSGHGSEYSWADGPVLSQAQVRGLTNTVFPYVYSFACVTGSYHLAECFGETWIRTATGGSAFYGSSVNSYWDEDDILEKKLFYAMFVDNLTKVTPMFDMGKYLTVMHFGGSVTPGSTMLRYIEMYNLLGDPSLETKRMLTPDPTPPDPIIDLLAGNATSNSITLSWTAPYDSTFGGIQGYDIRYSTLPIVTNDDFNSATQVLYAGQSDTAGAPKSFCVTGLTVNTLYYFAVKAMDLWSNKSPMSNIVYYSTLASPMISVNPGFIHHVLTNQVEIVDTVNIYNASSNQSTLDYNIEFLNNVFPTGAVTATVIPVKKAQTEGENKDNPKINFGQAILGAGGPDEFGYSWVDSDDPQGPAYVWEDISTTGTLISSWIPTGSLSSTDEGYAGPLNLGFNFKFYGQVKNQIYVSTNGFLTFTPVTSNAYTNAPIPDVALPNDIISPFWDDLDAKAPGTVHYKQDGNRFIIQFTNYQRYSGTASYTWQVVIHSGGKIIFYFSNMTGTINSATTGIENGTGNIGLQVAYNAVYIKNNLAVKLAAEPEWMITNSPLNGTLYQGNSAKVIIRIRTEDFQLGNYSMDMKITSNCGLNPVVNIPVTMALSVIPVELVSFNAEVSGNEAILNWETASEVNNSGFSIERKKLNSDFWETAGFVEGKGNSQELNFYQFIDRNLKPGKYSYRLKQIDFDGTFKLSHSTEIDLGVPEMFSISQNYPNPVRSDDATLISYTVPAQESQNLSIVNITVFDLLGNEIKTLVNYEHEPGSYNLKVNFNNFPSGVYFYKMNSGKFTAIKKFIVIK